MCIRDRNRIALLKDVFIWACERSAARYTAVRQSLGEPDPFRLQYRAALREIIRAVALERLDRKTAYVRIAAWAGKHVEAAQQNRFREVAEDEVSGLHEGNFARFQITPAQFKAWREVWDELEK